MRLGLLAEVGSCADVGGLVDTLATAEDEGFDAVWLGERPEAAGGALLVAAALAEATGRARIGVRAAPPALLHPLRLAEDLAMLDVVSGGRLDWIPAGGGGVREVGEVVSEPLDIVLRAWLGEPFAHSGPRHRFPELVCWPLPEQAPHPRVWLPCGWPAPPAADPAALGVAVDEWRDGASADGDLRRPVAVVCAVETEEGPRASVRGERATSRGRIVLGRDRAGWGEALARLRAGMAPDWLVVSVDAVERDDTGRPRWRALAERLLG
jgi:alkanesulfonate monooxygenase SsuD/methylene tetrahydromethanopterin reductase-like flavin-dependent oxidoreductase (luciferase family)